MGSRAAWLVLMVVTALVADDVMGFTRQDVQNILNDRAFVNRLFSCLIKDKGCDFITQIIKDNTHDALHGRCGACSRDERNLVAWGIKKARQRYPNEFQQVWSRYY